MGDRRRGLFESFSKLQFKEVFFIKNEFYIVRRVRGFRILVFRQRGLVQIFSDGEFFQGEVQGRGFSMLVFFQFFLQRYEVFVQRVGQADYGVQQRGVVAVVFAGLQVLEGSFVGRKGFRRAFEVAVVYQYGVEGRDQYGGVVRRQFFLQRYYAYQDVQGFGVLVGAQVVEGFFQFGSREEVDEFSGSADVADGVEQVEVFFEGQFAFGDYFFVEVFYQVFFGEDDVFDFFSESFQEVFLERFEV